MSWKLRDSTVDDMLTCSLKALHVGAHAACHLTANIQLMSGSRPRADAHVLFDIKCFYVRRYRNGLNVAQHMDSEAPDQDRSRRPRWFTVRRREFITLGHVSMATGRRRTRPGSFPSVVGPPAIQVLLCVECNTSPASFMHFWTSRPRSEKVSRVENDGKSIHVVLKCQPFQLGTSRTGRRN